MPRRRCQGVAAVRKEQFGILVMMGNTIEYASQKRLLGANRMSWIGYGCIYSPVVLTVLLCAGYAFLPQFIVSHFEHPATLSDSWHLQWHWERKLRGWGAYALLFPLLVNGCLIVLFFVSPTYEWMRRHTAKWALALPVNLLAL